MRWRKKHKDGEQDRGMEKKRSRELDQALGHTLQELHSCVLGITTLLPSVPPLAPHTGTRGRCLPARVESPSSCPSSSRGQEEGQARGWDRVQRRHSSSAGCPGDEARPGLDEPWWPAHVASPCPWTLTGSTALGTEDILFRVHPVSSGRPSAAETSGFVRDLSQKGSSPSLTKARVCPS